MELMAEMQAFITVAFSNVWLLVGNFLILIVLTLGLLIFSHRGGRSALLSLILALYAGYALYIVFPYTDLIVGAGGSPVVQAVISILLFFAGSALPYVLIRRITSGGFGSLSLFPNIILAFLAASFLLTLGYHVFDISNIYSFPAPLDHLFAPQGYFFWWFIAPLVGLYILAR
ncbi:hypothetical protein KKH15_01165 [Patescibacteria group bacterium]|nr:hypothetical protein [Patescibacteria group bacterium]MBU1754933.1 hypothetical protein [Patescibacteria group bacterium]